MNFKRVTSVFLAVLLVLVLAACGANNSSAQGSSGAKTEKDITKEPDPEDSTEIGAGITIFAADSSLIFMSTVSDMYIGERPSITTAVLFDEPVVLTEKILSNYDCDIFITDDPYYMNFIDKNGGEDNQYNLDLLVDGSRRVLFTAEDVSGGTIEYTAAVLKKSVCPLDCEQFLDWIAGLGDEVYDECGVARP